MMRMHRRVLLLMVSLALMASTSCDKTGGEKQSQEHHYALAMMKGQQFLVTTFSDLKEGVEVTSEDAVTLPLGHLSMKYYGGALYLMSGAMGGHGGEQNLYKYLLDERGHLPETPEKLVFAPGTNPMDVVFANENKAYVSTCGAKAELIVISLNPLQISSTIDLSPYAFEDNDPDAGNGYVRDGKLYLPLNQVASLQEIRPCPGQVAVIDVATDKVEKIIKDSRVTSLGMVGHTNVIEDEMGDIYIQTGLRTAMTMANPAAPSYAWGEGIVRIKKGETDFDKAYHLPITKLPGAEKGSYIMTWAYGGAGKAYGFLHIPSLGNMEQNSYAPYEVELNGGTGKKLDLPASSGWSALGVLREGDEIFFSISTQKEGNGIYSYNTKRSESKGTPVVKTQLPVFNIVKLGR